MSAVVVQYRVKPDRVEENAEPRGRAVYAELCRAPSRRGSTMRRYVQDDGRVSFVHFATVEDGHEAPLPQLPAFKAFVAEIAERCDEPPVDDQVAKRRSAPTGF